MADQSSPELTGLTQAQLPDPGVTRHAYRRRRELDITGVADQS